MAAEPTITRTERDKIAYDEQGVWDVSNKWQGRFSHVFDSPNTLRHERMFAERMQGKAKGKRVLDIGCGQGDLSEQLIEHGATYVLGIDISENLLGQAKSKAMPGVLEFRLQSVEEHLGETFDLIVGSSILHHIDYQEILPRFYKENLKADGLMMFQEPIGGGVLIRLFTSLVRRAHTPDERSFMKADLDWLQANFAHVEIVPFNYFSFALGILSSKVLKRPDNGLMRQADRWDVWLAKRARFLWPYFRRTLIFVHKPA